MGRLETDTAIRVEGGRTLATLSPNWEIWGPNGGYMAAICLRAAGAAAPADHRPATLSCQYVSAAKFGEVEARADVVKRGRNAWLVNVGLHQNDRLILQTQVWTTNKGEGPQNLDSPIPDVPGPNALPSLADRLAPDPPPTQGMWTNMDVRPVNWFGPAERHPQGAVLNEWYRFRDFAADGDVFLDCARSVILIDTLVWPAHHRGLMPRPDYIAPSLDLTVWFHQLPSMAEWLLADVRADVADGGLIHGRTKIFTEDGRAIATGGTNMLQMVRG